MNKERQTKFSNQILYNLFKNYTTRDIKILTIIINRLLSKYKSIKNKNEDNAEEFIYEIGISLEFINIYKGKKRLSIKEIMEIIEKISSFGVLISENGIHRKIMLVNEVRYDERYKSFKIFFNENIIEYLLLIEDKFTLIDLAIIKNLKSKYELGVYILVQMYKNTGYCIRKIDDLKDYFNTGGNTNDLLKYMRIAVLKLNQNYDYKLRLEEDKTGRRIDLVKIKFKKQ